LVGKVLPNEPNFWTETCGLWLSKNDNLENGIKICQKACDLA